MRPETEQDLFWVMACLEAISYNEDLSPEEEETIYNLYGYVKNELESVVDLSDYDPEKLV